MARANTFEIEKADKVTCKVCGKSDNGFILWYYPTFMNGDAEVEAKFCGKHKSDGQKLKRELEAPIKAEEKRREREQQKYEERKADRLRNDLKALQEKGYLIRDLNGSYQYRINGVLDIFPTSQLYHDIKKNKRGSYRNLVGFVQSFLTFNYPQTP